jgi:alanine racemase
VESTRKEGPLVAEPGQNGPRSLGARPTVAQVDLDALGHNLAVLRGLAAGAKLFPVVKADAYGHGLLPVARSLEQQGADGLCVALIEEGFRLRDAGVRLPLLVLNGVYGNEHAEVLARGLTPVVFRDDQLLAFAAAAGGRRVDVHVKVDTGMARLGVDPGELEAFLDRLESLPALRIAGVMTHLSSADSDPQQTALQLSRFEAALGAIRARGHRPDVVHAANSAAAIGVPAARYDLVRPGIAVYGVSPLRRAPSGLRSVLSLHSQVVMLRSLPAGAPVGYDTSFRALRDSRIATVPIGYGDGLLRAASGSGHMLVRGRRCPIVGRVSMDLTTLDVTDLPACELGDPVTVIGEQGGSALTADDLADACGTIAYEVLTQISPRVPRSYLGG